MSLDVLWKLDPTSPTSNSNFAGANVSENCPPSGINNALRSLGQMVAQQLCYRSSDISASVSTNIATTSTGLFMSVAGANAINSFGTVPGEQPSAAVVRILHYLSSASVSHNGATIILLGSASRRMQPGDVQGMIHDGSGDTWREFLFHRRDGSQLAESISATTLTAGSISTSAISTVTLNAASASISSILLASIQATSISASVGSFGTLEYGTTRLSDIYVQTVTASTAASSSTSNNIPFDTSIPQNSEGTNAISLAITPRNASSILEVEGIVYVHAVSGAGVEIIASLFLDNAANAIAAGSIEQASNSVMPIPIYFEHTASTTTEHVYALRYGADAGIARLNHGAGGNLGGVLRSWMRVRERLP